MSVAYICRVGTPKRPNFLRLWRMLGLYILVTFLTASTSVNFTGFSHNLATFLDYGCLAIRRYRSANTKGKVKHFAFIEFKAPGIVDIVARAMNGYRMLGRTLVCQALTPDKVHPKYCFI